jgi:hypothetical protein
MSKPLSKLLEVFSLSICIGLLVMSCDGNPETLPSPTESGGGDALFRRGDCCMEEGSIDATFNGTDLTGTGTNPGVWFNANFKVSDGEMLPGSIVRLRNSVVTINGTPYAVPDAIIRFAEVDCATTGFQNGIWITRVPVDGDDEIFLSGVYLGFPDGLEGGAEVTWSGMIGTDQPGVCLSWKWGAAAYTGFPEDYNEAQIKPTHHDACEYNTSHHAGTPENPDVQANVTGGARGGGGSNWTGSWSGTSEVCPVCP